MKCTEKRFTNEGLSNFFRLFFLSLIVFSYLHFGDSLSVNVGSSFSNSFPNKMNVIGNSSTGTVLLEYRSLDGTLISQLNEIKRHISVTRVILLGDEDLFPTPLFQVFCFISSIAQGELISEEAVSKLRQKNPRTVRWAEQDLGTTRLELSSRILYDKLVLLSPLLPDFCRSAQNTTFSSETEINLIARNGLGSSFSLVKKTLLFPIVKKLSDQRCVHLDYNHEGPCDCALQIDFNWIPCALKYCKNKEREGEHRCGISTCRKSYIFLFSTTHKIHCLWDKDDEI